MKKNILRAIILTLVISFLFMIAGCASTIKYSKGLNRENSATLMINHLPNPDIYVDRDLFISLGENKNMAGGNIRGGNVYNHNHRWFLTVNKFNDEIVSWDKNIRRGTEILIPTGEHVLECWIYSQVHKRYVIASIPISANSGEYHNLSISVAQNSKYISSGNVDEMFTFYLTNRKFALGKNTLEHFVLTYENTPQYYKDMQEGKNMVNLDTATVLLEPNSGGAPMSRSRFMSIEFRGNTWVANF